MLMIPHCLDNRLIDGGKVVSTCRTLLPTNIFFNVSSTHLCYRLCKPQGQVRPEGLGKFKISPHRVSNQRPSALPIGYHVPSVLSLKLMKSSKLWAITARNWEFVVSIAYVILHRRRSGNCIPCPRPPTEQC
jgi:hypothetical protein